MPCNHVGSYTVIIINNSEQHYQSQTPDSFSQGWEAYHRELAAAQGTLTQQEVHYKTVVWSSDDSTETLSRHQEVRLPESH